MWNLICYLLITASNLVATLLTASLSGRMNTRITEEAHETSIFSQPSERKRRVLVYSKIFVLSSAALRVFLTSLRLVPDQIYDAGVLMRDRGQR